MKSKNAEKKAKKHTGSSVAVRATTYNNLMTELSNNPYKFRYQLFGSTKEITIHQQFEFGIGGVLWDCGLLLARYLTTQNNLCRWRGTVVVELGAGTALPSLICWQLGAKKVVATDLEEVVHRITAPSIFYNSSNGGCGDCTSAVVRWGEQLDAAQLRESLQRGRSTSPTIDYILAADVVYRSEDHPKLLQTLELLADPKTVIIFVHRPRLNNDDNFVDPLKATFKLQASTPVTTVVPAYPKENATFYEFCGHNLRDSEIQR